MEKEKQLAEEFEKIQKQLSEDLKQQMERNYQQKILRDTQEEQDEANNGNIQGTRTATRKFVKGRL